jgi:hypothetical protein
MIEEAHGNIPRSVVHEMSAGLPPDLGPTPRVRRRTDVEHVPPPGAARARRHRHAPAATNGANSRAGSTRASRDDCAWISTVRRAGRPTPAAFRDSEPAPRPPRRTVRTPARARPVRAGALSLLDSGRAMRRRPIPATSSSVCPRYRSRRRADRLEDSSIASADRRGHGTDPVVGHMGIFPTAMAQWAWALPTAVRGHFPFSTTTAISAGVATPAITPGEDSRPRNVYHRYLTRTHSTFALSRPPPILIAGQE